MPAESRNPLYIGMLSGTSRDGVDVALTSIGGNNIELIASTCVPYPQALSAALSELIDAGTRPNTEQLQELDRTLGEFFASAAHKLIESAGVKPSEITAIGSHGQTVWHEPPESIQLGNAGIIAESTGIRTVADFRSADLDAGGQGAPLAPLLHRELFKPEHGFRAVLNLGGIANVSLIEPGGSVTGFDTGPGNCLINAWINRDRGAAFDQDGEWAAAGTSLQPLLMTLLQDPYFSQLPPKSTGVEYFNLKWLESKVDADAFRPVDIQATLAELSAQSIVSSLPPEVNEVLVCGGGVHNRHLMSRLASLKPSLPFTSTTDHGLDPDFVESVLFAWLAHERLAGSAQDTTAITGASRPVLLGRVYEPV